jgi:hypothetical protein
VRPVEPDEVEGAWIVAEPGLAVAVRRSHQMATLREVKGMLLLGAYQLHLLFVDELYAGAAVTRFDPDGNGGLWVNLLFVYTVPDIAHAVDVLRGCQPAVFQWARDRGATAAHFYSARGGFARRRAEELGWKPRFVEYVQPL